MSLHRRALLLGSLGLPWCGVAARAAQRMVVTEYGVVVSTLPWAVALDLGLMQKLGTGVDGFVSANGGGTAVRNMMASDLPMAEMSVPAAIAAIRTGIDLKFVFSSVNNNGEMAWVTRADSPIRTIADLKGRKVGFTSPRSTTEMILRIILNKAGLSDQVQIVPTGGVGAGVTALNQGAIDATPMIDPLLTTAADRYHTVFQANEYLPDFCWNVGVTTSAFASGHGEQISHLIEARRQAVVAMQQDLQVAARVYAKVWNVEPAIAVEVLPKLFKMNFWSQGNFDMTGLKAQIDGMLLVGLIDNPVDLGKLVDRQFLPADLRA